MSCRCAQLLVSRVAIVMSRDMARQTFVFAVAAAVVLAPDTWDHFATNHVHPFV